MKKVLHKSDSRGHSVHNWLDSHHTFSFADYYDPQRVHFGALRVLNDDRVAPGEGFQTHPHKNMEIVSIPLKGYLAHGDSRQNSRTISVGDIQVMSAGTGIYHSEMNASPSEPVEFLQIWIMPKERNTPPRYQDYDVRGLMKKNELALIVAPDGSTPASLLQDAWFSLGEVETGQKIEYKLHRADTGVYVFIIEGEVKVDDVTLGKRDGLGISETKSFTLETTEDSKILLIEVPV